MSDERLNGAAGEGDEPVEHAGVRPGLDRVGEAAAGRTSGLMIWRATPRTCWVTSSETTTRWPVAWAKSHAWTRNSIDRMPRAAPAGISCGPTLTSPSSPRACHASSVACAAAATRASRLARGRARLSAGRGAEEGDRPDQVFGQLGHVELGAALGAVIVGFGDAAQDELAGGQRGLGGAEGIQVRRGRRPLVGAGVPSAAAVTSRPR